MSTTAIACELMTLNTRSSDFPFIAGGGSANAIVATSTTDGWVISPPSAVEFGERLVIILGSDGTGGTVTFKAGDRYPAHRVDLGDLTRRAASCRTTARSSLSRPQRASC
jgi:hypothetical protein